MTPISSRTCLISRVISFKLLLKCFTLFVDGIRALATEENRQEMKLWCQKRCAKCSAKCKDMNSTEFKHLHSYLKSNVFRCTYNKCRSAFVGDLPKNKQTLFLTKLISNTDTDSSCEPIFSTNYESFSCVFRIFVPLVVKLHDTSSNCWISLRNSPSIYCRAFLGWFSFLNLIPISQKSQATMNGMNRLTYPLQNHCLETLVFTRVMREIYIFWLILWLFQLKKCCIIPVSLLDLTTETKLRTLHSDSSVKPKGERL